MSDRSARLKEMQERQEELESNNKRLQQEEQDLREKYHEVWILTCNSLQPRTKPVDTHYKNTYFLQSSSQKIFANWKPVSRLPYSNAVCGNTRNAHVSFYDCSMARNYETHGNVKWALSGVVECVVRHSKTSGRSRGGAPGAWSSLFVDQTETQRAEKLFFEDELNVKSEIEIAKNLTSNLPIPRGPCSSQSRFFLYWLYDCIFQL